MAGTALEVKAVAHFTSGDVTVQLRSVDGRVAFGKIAVPAAQAGGIVKVDFTVTYGGVTQPVITADARIKASKK